MQWFANKPVSSRYREMWNDILQKCHFVNVFKKIKKTIVEIGMDSRSLGEQRLDLNGRLCGLVLLRCGCFPVTTASQRQELLGRFSGQ